MKIDRRYRLLRSPRVSISQGGGGLLWLRLARTDDGWTRQASSGWTEVAHTFEALDFGRVVGLQITLSGRVRSSRAECPRGRIAN